MRVTILYLAAGNSRRFGENKLLYPLDGKAVYRHLLDRLAQIAGRHENWELLVVTQYERIPEELAPLVKAGRLQTVFSPDSEKGISYTIRAGIEAAEKQNADACACFVADQPYMKEETALHETLDGRISFTKGSPDEILERCRYVWSNGKTAAFSAAARAAIRRGFQNLIFQN